MIVLIAKQNEELIQSMIPNKKLKFEESTKNTSTFKVSKNVFNKLFNELRYQNYNPYALMTWWKKIKNFIWIYQNFVVSLWYHLKIKSHEKNWFTFNVCWNIYYGVINSSYYVVWSWVTFTFVGWSCWINWVFYYGLFCL